MEIYSGHEGKDRVCCNCKHNIRIPQKTYTECNCDIDGHYIGYIECFDCWCRRWARERRCDGNTDFRRVTSINKSIMIDAIQQTDTILEAEE